MSSPEEAIQKLEELKSITERLELLVRTCDVPILGSHHLGEFKQGLLDTIKDILYQKHMETKQPSEAIQTLPCVNCGEIIHANTRECPKCKVEQPPLEQRPEY